MTEPHRAVIARLSSDFAAISQQLSRVSADLTELDRLLTERPPVAAPPPQPAPPVAPAPQSAPAWRQYAPPPPWPHAPVYRPLPPRPPIPAPPRQRSEGWIGKALAVAGVAVTLIGVVLLLVLAAQAGILRPELRVAAGGVLAGALVGAGWWVNRRPGGRVGAIALAATGVAAAYIDVIAVTTVYEWLPAPAGLVLAAVIGGAGLTLARRWESEHLGLLVLVPLLILAPVVTEGITLTLLAFMLALSAASLPVQLGRDWTWLHAARTAAVTVPLLVALAGAAIDSRDDLLLAVACAIAALLALAGALIVLPRTTNRAALALLTAAGVLPVLCVSATVDRVVASLMIAALAAALLAIVLGGTWLPAVSGVVRQIWSALSAISALVAVNVAFDGEVAAPLLLAMATLVAIAGRRDDVARWAAVGFAVVGGLLYLAYAPPGALITATVLSTPDAVSVLIASVLLTAAALAIAWSHADDANTELARVLWAGSAVVGLYAATTLLVTAGVLIGGVDGGFFAGHMAATICWIAAAAALLGYAARKTREQRSLPIGGGMALVAAAVAKLFLFDLGTLDGIFRVAVFIVVGLILLGMGTGYARLLAAQDQQQDVSPLTQ
ncbi:DUF2339 domain-containing protein [Mycolicibacterium sp. S2-37]|uniref:DUF2339 domain-containing protein n=1 Tax=Mycolicibacterium sp. S2-37 TaxID=2810297 RepID=UPI001A946C11|nr:DUF2339 domain-containing protein [Mycolicibacterium sp. S2-37]MBO0680595.1 DUF2339 domain-containing protein [Mycolicibacterium sp. S2-37]